jgi:hypothetical protein
MVGRSPVDEIFFAIPQFLPQRIHFGNRGSAR